jgi:hypothetical protein
LVLLVGFLLLLLIVALIHNSFVDSSIDVALAPSIVPDAGATAIPEVPSGVGKCVLIPVFVASISSGHVPN